MIGRIASRTDPVRLGVVIAGVIALLGLLGCVHAVVVRLEPFDLNGEGTVTAVFSASLLLAAALVASAASRLVRPRSWGLLVLGPFLAFMAVDELVSLHEKLELALGVDWQTVYLPVILVGGVAWVATLRDLRPRSSGRMLFVAGACAWVVAQVCEKLQYEGERLVHPVLSLPEETLEMAGSTLFLLALLRTVRALLPTEAAATDGPVPAPSLRAVSRP